MNNKITLKELKTRIEQQEKFLNDAYIGVLSKMEKYLKSPYYRETYIQVYNDYEKELHYYNAFRLELFEMDNIYRKAMKRYKNENHYISNTVTGKLKELKEKRYKLWDDMKGAAI